MHIFRRKSGIQDIDVGLHLDLDLNVIKGNTFE